MHGGGLNSCGSRIEHHGGNGNVGRGAGSGVCCNDGEKGGDGTCDELELLTRNKIIMRML